MIVGTDEGRWPRSLHLIDVFGEGTLRAIIPGPQNLERKAPAFPRQVKLDKRAFGSRPAAWLAGIARGMGRSS